eukprot:TRINITY_DN12715_c0_g1_i1.p1 TRINITY_DN12715_c0_g1~~TRINITY_DN12715_c0_g1_i1.p1  ORF type:complete len:365 (-),score=93.82 TRINITY_DN12715_c0_g1_i1:114-1181(-)
MSTFAKQVVTGPISCHAFNADRTKFAYCPNNNHIHILAKSGTEWNEEHVLKEHDKLVTSIDWGSKTNRLVSCSQDRNAYVWTLTEGLWKPTLVILRINRAATHVKWSPFENKFAVASGSKCVSVCYFEEEQDWWVSKHIKKHQSTVLKVDWHPNNTLLATASSDNKCRVVAAAIKGVDKRPPQTVFGVKAFGEVLAEYPAGGWVHAVKWSPDGLGLAYASHDSTVTIVDSHNSVYDDYQVIKLKGLPVVDILYLSNSKIVTGGHDCQPIVFTFTDKWVQGASIDKKVEVKKGPDSRAAFNMFKNKVETGQNANATTLDTTHQNCITQISVLAGTNEAVSAFATTGSDGKLVFWKA